MLTIFFHTHSEGFSCKITSEVVSLHSRRNIYKHLEYHSSSGATNETYEELHLAWDHIFREASDAPYAKMFSVIIPGRPCITEIQNVSPNQFAFTFSAAPQFSHIVVFILPGNNLPDGTAVGVYLQLPGASQFQFLGGLANEKQSAIFKVNVPASTNGGTVSLGLSIEPMANVEQQILQLKDQQHTNSASKSIPTTKVLAQRIIQHAFNFISGFSGHVAGQEVVPLKAFQDWWTKFERRIENDPSFLEKAES